VLKIPPNYNFGLLQLLLLIFTKVKTGLKKFYSMDAMSHSGRIFTDPNQP